jgi:glycosyltransferase involved in cell wall biosynthesis
LAKLQIQATYVPITSIDTGILGTLNSQIIKDIDFFSYVPFERFSFYGGNKIVKLAQRWDQYRFLIICPDLTEIPADFIAKMPKNIQFSPRVERDAMPELYQRSKFFIRYTQHDGLSVSVLEALYFNLQVLWTHDFPCTHKISNLETLSDSIPSLVENWQPNLRGHAFVTENYSLEKCRANYVAIMQRKFKLP